MITISKDMEVGIDIIDEQHRELVNRINAVTSMGAKSVSDEETQKTIDLLGEYIIKHFTDEENLQKKYNFPKYEWHKEQHKILTNAYTDIKKEYAQTGPSPKFTLDMSNMIINWIIRHIKSADIEFGKYYRSQK